jgi:peptidoglycan/xylan/chitin deacetylase (PgdA/CDA1 family)
MPPWLAQLLPSYVEPSQRTLKVNLQVDAEQEEGTTGITNIVNELKARGLQATIYVTGDYAQSHALLIQGFYNDGFEIALHGQSSGEQLARMSYAAQQSLLTNAKAILEGCQTCGTFKPILGFRPQYFSQNTDTYTVLDELGMSYDSGFKAGLLYAAGHETDAAPYAIAGHSFYAVPISTAVYNEERLYICDVAAQAKPLTGAQWGELLQAGLQEAVDNSQPYVVLVHGWVTGNRDQYDYWQPFVSLLDQIQNQAQFLTTQELVDLHR